jgi:phosphoribosylglycinamide formyltransferase 1
MRRLAILLSGRGSNFEAIARAVERGEIRDAAIVAVVSDVPSAPGLSNARARGLPAFAIDRAQFSTRRTYEGEVLRVLDAVRPELLCLAGYMRILSPEFISRYPGRILNIHPSLLPKYPGLNAQQRALEAGDTVAGCTVHRVEEGVDSGPVLLQRKVSIEPGDTVGSLSQRILEEEHRAYPAAIARALDELPAEP